jgi:hypothetical protein
MSMEPTMYFELLGTRARVPGSWLDQGMITFMLPSIDPDVRPNLLLVKERLSSPVDLADYVDRIIAGLTHRGIQSFQIVQLYDCRVSGRRIPAKVLVCEWDLGDVARFRRLERRRVCQYQLSAIYEDQAITLTATVPSEHQDYYLGQIERFVSSLEIGPPTPTEQGLPEP